MKAKPKEIAALVVAIQERQKSVVKQSAIMGSKSDIDDFMSVFNQKLREALIQ